MSTMFYVFKNIVKNINANVQAGLWPAGPMWIVGRVRFLRVNFLCLASHIRHSARRGKFCILPISRYVLPIASPIFRHFLFSPVSRHFSCSPVSRHLVKILHKIVLPLRGKTFNQCNEETMADQQKDKDKDKYNDIDKDKYI